MHYCCYWGLPHCLRKCLKLIEPWDKNAYNKSPLEIAYLKRKSADECYQMLKKRLPSHYEADILFTSLNLSIGRIDMKTPFMEEFYEEYSDIQLISWDEFEVHTEKIIDINSSYTIYHGTMNKEDIVIKEIFEKYSSLRQTESLKSQLVKFK